MIRLLLVLLLSFSLSHNSSSQDCETVPQVINTTDFVLKKSCSPYTIEKSLVVSEGRKLTVEDGVVINFLTSDKYIDVRGELIVGKGVTFNMGQDTYIKTENTTDQTMPNKLRTPSPRNAYLKRSNKLVKGFA